MRSVRSVRSVRRVRSVRSVRSVWGVRGVGCGVWGVGRWCGVVWCVLCVG